MEKTVEKILVAMKQYPIITQNNLMQITGLTRRVVEWQIKKLKENGKIERIG